MIVFEFARLFDCNRAIILSAVVTPIEVLPMKKHYMCFGFTLLALFKLLVLIVILASYLPHLRVLGIAHISPSMRYF